MAVSPVNMLTNFAGAYNSLVPLKFSAIARSETNVLLSFPTATGPSGSTGPEYEVLTNAVPGSANWVSATNVTGNGAVQTVILPAALSRLFFRLRVP